MDSVSQKSEKNESKKRQAKATSRQINYMVDYFVHNPHVATGKFNSLHGNADLRGSWEELVSALNSMNKDGKTKDVKSWKSTWRDNKTAVSQKVTKRRANQAKTGNVDGPPIKLTEREQKILGLMGFDYVEGVQCPDSFPEEQPEALALLSEGQEDILTLIPSTMTLRNNHDVNSNDVEPADFVDFEILDFDVGSITQATNSTQAPSTTQILEKCEHHHQTIDAPSRSQIEQLPAAQPHPNTSRGLNVTRKAATVTRRNRERLGTQLQNAREDFMTLSERQVSCMEMFAKAMKQIADNDRERNEILQTFITSAEAREKTFSELTTILKDCVEVLKRK